jgi:SOS response associated peptidase (SRAP)
MPRVASPTPAFIVPLSRPRFAGAGETVKSCAMVVTDANEFVPEVHDRMPVILEADQFEPWLLGGAGVELLKPAANDVLQRWPVSKRVNSSRASDDWSEWQECGCDHEPLIWLAVFDKCASLAYSVCVPNLSVIPPMIYAAICAFVSAEQHRVLPVWIWLQQQASLASGLLRAPLRSRSWR